MSFCWRGDRLGIVNAAAVEAAMRDPYGRALIIALRMVNGY